MRPMPQTPVAAAGEAVGWPARAAALAPRIEAAGRDIERERRIPEPLLATLLGDGFFRLLLPRSFGGAELDPPTFVRTIETIARADASVAWCLCQAAGCSMTAAYLPPDAARAIFGPQRAVLAWGPGPSHAVPVEGGWRVTASCSFASGSRHVTWLGAHCAIREPDGEPRRRPDGRSVVRTMLFPANETELRDVWDVVGLNGTGSDSFTVTDLFVPAAHSVARDDPADRREAGPLYRFTSNACYSAGFAGVALGIARGALDAFLALARDKTPRGFKATMRENAVVQLQAARCSARLDAARLFLLATLDEEWSAACQGDGPTLDQRMRLRLASTHAIQEAMAVVDTAYHAAGATAIFAGNPFERRLRDIHTVAQQVQGRQSHYETVGQHLLGLDPDMTFL